jgi:hypothetical protein
MLHSDEPLRSPDLFNARVHELTRLAHHRKLRGLYVDYEDGALQLPGHITEQEAWQLIHLTQEQLDRDRAEWGDQLNKAQWVSQFSKRPPHLGHISLLGRLHIPGHDDARPARRHDSGRARLPRP